MSAHAVERRSRVVSTDCFGSGSDLAWIGHGRGSLTGQEQTYSWRFQFSLKRPVGQ